MMTIFGTSGTDYMRPLIGVSTYRMEAGDDRFIVGRDPSGQAHTVFGGDGRDNVSGGADPVTFFGDEGRDYLSAGQGTFHFDGGPGSDRIYLMGTFADMRQGVATTPLGQLATFTNVEELFGSFGSDTIFGGDGDDWLHGSYYGDDVLYGRGGNDILRAEVDLLQVTEVGATYARRDYDASTLYGGAGDDDLYTGHIMSTLFGGEGADRLTSVTVGATLYGGSGDDSLHQDWFGDTPGPMFGGDGNDSLSSYRPMLGYGGAGDDVFHAGEVRALDRGSELYGGTGNDTFETGAAADVIFGGAGYTTARSGSGDDLIVLGAQNATIDGGAGSDTVILGQPGEEVQHALDGMILGRGHSLTLTNVERVVGSTGDDMVQIYGTIPARIEGRAGNDRLLGDNDNNELIGGPGDDWMSGGRGDDTYGVNSLGDVVVEWSDEDRGGTDTVLASISMVVPEHIEILHLQGSADLTAQGTAAPETLLGNAGDNVLTGAAGGDTLDGGAGADVFAYTAAADSPGGAGGTDVITGFEAGLDRIELSRIAGFSFIDTAAFSGTGPELRLSAPSAANVVTVEADVNGDTLTDLQIRVETAQRLHQEDFIL